MRKKYYFGEILNKMSEKGGEGLPPPPQYAHALDFRVKFMIYALILLFLYLGVWIFLITDTMSILENFCLQLGIEILVLYQIF